MKLCERCRKREATHNHAKDGNHNNWKEENREHLCDLCHAKEHNISPKYTEIRRLVKFYDTAQKTKDSIKNKIRSLGRIELDIPESLKDVLKMLESLEEHYVEEIGKWFKNNPSELNEWLLSIKGISYILAAKVLSYFLNRNFQKVSSLWHFAGHAPGCKPKKHEKMNYNPGFRVILYQVSNSFKQRRTPKYREKYDIEKEKRVNQGMINNKTGKANKHAELLAIKKMMKTFLRDLYNMNKAAGSAHNSDGHSAPYLSGLSAASIEKRT